MGNRGPQRRGRGSEGEMALAGRLMVIGGHLLRTAPAAPALAFASGIRPGAAVAVAAFRAAADMLQSR
jgi:hypothetical protein